MGPCPRRSRGWACTCTTCRCATHSVPQLRWPIREDSVRYSGCSVCNSARGPTVRAHRRTRGDAIAQDVVSHDSCYRNSRVTGPDAAGNFQLQV
jgi:hypothetical protein